MHIFIFIVIYFYCTSKVMAHSFLSLISNWSNRDERYFSSCNISTDECVEIYNIFIKGVDQLYLPKLFRKYTITFKNGYHNFLGNIVKHVVTYHRKLFSNHVNNQSNQLFLFLRNVLLQVIQLRIKSVKIRFAQ